MAIGEIEVGRRESLLARLLTPRPITLIVLAGGGAALGELAFRFVPYQLYVYLTGLAGPMCMAAAVAAWSMRDKVDATFDAEYLAPRAYTETRPIVRDVRARSMWLAAACMLCAGLAAGPAFSAQLLNVVYEWMLICSGLGIGLAAYCFQIAFAWEDQLRSHRERLIAGAKELEARDALEARLISSGPAAPGYWGPGWTEPPKTAGRKKH